jgi:glycerol-3-phosphate dehydrogenase (NAD(P)+)
VQLGGAVKNVIAIAAGVSDGLQYGANAKSALITRGLAEMMRLGSAMGARRETFMGLSGLGDLVLTCTDDQSRNRRLGLGIAANKTPETIKEEIGEVIEGITTVHQVMELAKRYYADVPICTQVYRVLHQEMHPRDAVLELFSRHPKAEY